MSKEYSETEGIIIFRDRELTSAIIKIGIPIGLQNMLTSLLNMIDTIMIGSLGDSAVAAVGLANQWFFIFNLGIFGIVSGSTIFVAQYFGKGDMENLQVPVAYSMFLCAVLSCVFGLMAALAPSTVMRLFTDDLSTVADGVPYLRIASISYFMLALSLPIANAMRTTESAVIPLAVTGSALLINTFLNYVLIYGRFGAPALGVTGAATATSTARVIETALIVGFTFSDRVKIKIRAKYFKLRHDFIGKYIRTIAPVVGNEGMWGLGTSMYNVMFGHTNNAIVAANQVSKNLEQIITALSIGVASAGAVIVGRKIGEREPEEAYVYGGKFAVLSSLTGFVLGVVMLVFMPLYLDLFSISPEAKVYAEYLIAAYAVFMAFKMYNYMNIVGILRSGGDTRFCLILDTGSVWLVGVLLTFLALFVFDAPFWVVALCIVSEELIKAVIGFIRFKSRKWINDLVN